MTVQCTCCGSDCEWPQFYNGKPYGYTCILGVNPGQKRSKGSIWVKADKMMLTYVGQNDHQIVYTVKATYKGRTYSHGKNLGFYINKDTGQVLDPKYINVLGGLICVWHDKARFDGGSYSPAATWKGFVVRGGEVIHEYSNEVVGLISKQKRK